MGVVNHLGHCVADLDRSRTFYVEVLGFEPWREISPPDSPTDRMLRLTAPVGLTACYLRSGEFVLELLHFSGSGAAGVPFRARAMNEPGLTHFSMSVDDVAETCRRVAELGGEVLDDTDIGGGIFVRDPDGQLLEILPMAYAERVAQER
jgi:lactoylglutathione lyase